MLFCFLSALRAHAHMSRGAVQLNSCLGVAACFVEFAYSLPVKQIMMSFQNNISSDELEILIKCLRIPALRGRLWRLLRTLWPELYGEYLFSGWGLTPQSHPKLPSLQFHSLFPAKSVTSLSAKLQKAQLLKVAQLSGNFTCSTNFLL